MTPRFDERPIDDTPLHTVDLPDTRAWKEDLRDHGR